MVLLLLIGFYRISDIIAGVISNVFYQDLNFTKEQIAEAVKIYGVIFSLVGGFLGGLLAQRMNIMKLMFVGAVLASSTNLIFIGLVKSGHPLGQVQVNVGGQQYLADTDEVGYWAVKVPTEVLKNTTQFQVSTAYADAAQQSKVAVVQPYIVGDINRAHLMLLPVMGQNIISLNEPQNSIVVKGQYFGPALTDAQKIVLQLDGKPYPAKLDKTGAFSAVVETKMLTGSSTKQLQAIVTDGSRTLVNTSLAFHVAQGVGAKNELDISVEPVALVNPNDQSNIELKGKVIKPYSSLWLYFAIVVDNLASGLAGAAFIAFLSSLTSVSFTAVQYAIFSSLMTLTPKLLGGYSGTIVTHIGYPQFFLMTTLIGIPILVLVVWVAKLLKAHELKQIQMKGTGD